MIVISLGLMDGWCMYNFEPKTDVECVFLAYEGMNDFHKPSIDVEFGIDDTCIILNLGLIFISLGLMLFFLFSLFRCRKI